MMKNNIDKRYNTAGQALHPAPAAPSAAEPQGIIPFGSSLARSCPCKHGRDLAPFVNKGFPLDLEAIKFTACNGFYRRDLFPEDEEAMEAALDILDAQGCWEKFKTKADPRTREPSAGEASADKTPVAASARRSGPDDDPEIQKYTETIRLKPEYPFAYSDRGDAYLQKGQYDLAIKDFTEAIRLDATCFDAFRRRGDIYMRNGQYDQAIENYTELIRLKPNSYYAYITRGKSYWMEGQYDKAIEDCTEAIRLNSWPDNAYAYCGRGRAYLLKGQLDEVIKDFTEAIGLRPEFDYAYNWRGDAYLRKGRYERAIEDYTELIKLAPEFAPAYRSRGIAYQQLYKKELAMQDLGKALNIDPDDELAKSELEKMKPKVYNIEEFQNNLDSLGKSLGESLFKIMARKNPVTVKYINGELTEKAAIDELISSGFSGEEAVTFMADIRKCFGV